MELSDKDQKKLETETLVSYNQLENFIQIYTCDKELIKQLIKLNYEVISKNKESASFKCPKECLKISFSPVKIVDKKKTTNKKTTTKTTRKSTKKGD